jgi:hypothetical protein
MDDEVPKLERLFDWVSRWQLLTPEAVLGAGTGGTGGTGAGASSSSDPPLPPPPPDDSDDDDDDDDEEDGDASGNGLVWDSSSRRFRISISRTLRYLKGPEPPWLVEALEEWCAWRLYLLDSLVPKESSVTETDLAQLSDDLYDIDRDGLDALNADDTDPATHEQEQKDMLLQKIDLAWRKRRQRRERDSDLIRGQLRGLRQLKAKRANPDAAADSQVQSQALSSEQDDQMRRDADRIVASAEAKEEWWGEFSKPRARMHAQTNLLSGTKDSGGNRNAAQRAYLSWIRKTNTDKESELRSAVRTINRKQTVSYQNKWLNETYGSPYSLYWPHGKRANATNTSLEHIVPSEWLRTQETVLECGLPRQDATICTLANQSENSARGEKALSVFGSSTSDSSLYTPPDANKAKRSLLAKSTMHGFLSYPFVQQETKSAGSKRLAGTFGAAEYARRFESLLSAALEPASDWERRIALVNAVRHKWHNPLTLRPTLARNPKYKSILEMRLRGGRNTVLDCGLALLVDTQLMNVAANGPV